MDRIVLAGVILMGFLLDLVFGDPHFLYHPVRMIGNLIQAAEKVLRFFFRKEKGLLLAGGLLAVLVCSATGACAWGILKIAGLFGPRVWLLAEILLTYQLLAVKSLRVESMAVYRALKEGNLEKARKAVSMIVGRDTSVLDETGVAKAAIETVAENASDGVGAPLFYLAVGGPVLGWMYKAVNTMDSMVGYKNEKYLYFGRAAAKVDDLLNFIPASLSGLFMVAAAFLLSMDWKGAWKIFMRDRKKHSSPNSAHTEAACAGALGIRLAGDAWYFGRLHKKDTLGDPLKPVEYEDIRRANRLMYGMAVLSVLAAAGVQILVVQLL